MNSKPNTDKRILTSQNSPEIAERIKQASAEIMKRNYNLYKELENKWATLPRTSSYYLPIVALLIHMGGILDYEKYQRQTNTADQVTYSWLLLKTKSRPVWAAILIPRWKCAPKNKGSCTNARAYSSNILIEISQWKCPKHTNKNDYECHILASLIKCSIIFQGFTA